MMLSCLGLWICVKRRERELEKWEVHCQGLAPGISRDYRAIGAEVGRYSAGT